jgi:integrase
MAPTMPGEDLTSEPSFDPMACHGKMHSAQGGIIVAADAISLPSRTESPSKPSALADSPSPSPALSPQDSIDFLLHPSEIAKGRRAAENYLSSFKSEESRRMAEEALETLATVISGGKCDSLDFPWQQVRPYHGAAALTILKEKGAPARIEALRCRRDSTRSYRVVPESYPPRQVQKIRSTLTKVIEECCELGFVSEDARDADADTRGGARTSRKARTTRRKRAPQKTARQRRLLADGEIRALVAASAADETVAGARDAVLFSLVYRGLKVAEITSLTIESVRFSNKTGVCHITTRPGRNGGRGRRVALTNAELICLEDWLEHRGDEEGPLLCTISRNGRIEGKRLTLEMLKAVCEERALQAEVEPFVPNDLSRSAEALTQHRKAARRRSARQAQETTSEAEQVLFEGDVDPNPDGEAIRFPFLGLSL